MVVFGGRISTPQNFIVITCTAKKSRIGICRKNWVVLRLRKMMNASSPPLPLASPGLSRKAAHLNGLQNRKRIWLVIAPTTAVVIVKGVFGWALFVNKKIHQINLLHFIRCAPMEK